jgi:hypothetical protein
MTGRQLNIAIKGEQYEKAFDSIASRFLSVVKVPNRPDDYGIDAYCHVLRPLDSISTTVDGAFGVQVRGSGCSLQFGGMDRNGEKWKAYEIEWLRTLIMPLYLARVSEDYCQVNFYSLWPIWLVLGGSAAPYRIVCQFGDSSDSRFVLQDATTEVDGAHGDRTTSYVHIGPPFLSVSQEELNAPEFKERASALMREWVETDRLTVMMLLLRIANVKGIREWSTNDFESKNRVLKTWLAYSSVPGQNIGDICGVFEPVITNLGWNLQRQDDPAAYNLITALEWLHSAARLSGFGIDLLQALKTTQAQGNSPRPPA